MKLEVPTPCRAVHFWRGATSWGVSYLWWHQASPEVMCWQISKQYFYLVFTYCKTKENTASRIYDLTARSHQCYNCGISQLGLNSQKGRWAGKNHCPAQALQTPIRRCNRRVIRTFLPHVTTMKPKLAERESKYLPDHGFVCKSSWRQTNALVTLNNLHFIPIL